MAQADEGPTGIEQVGACQLNSDGGFLLGASPSSVAQLECQEKPVVSEGPRVKGLVPSQ